MEETERQHSPPPKEINSPNTVSPQFSGLNSKNSPGPSSHISTPSQHPELAAYSMSSVPLPSTSMGSSKDFLPIYSSFPAPPPYLDKFSTPSPTTDFSPLPYSSGAAPFPHFGWDAMSVPQTFGMPVRY